ncbi:MULTISPECIES: hypothetical protein [Phyllobacteriaceae]|uniref:KTSC domain-containing protein n=1 Tax=Phyllobacterium phragmitis TaxID=2670329 RepID=A0ABQ0H5C5_9HYPH|nr:hypothetical protein [Mesorhizobium sp. RMAD-H1]MBB2972674.1 hypothetical protein [Mesorhizobium sp. RMAD-H1]
MADRKSAEPKWLKAVGLDAQYSSDDELVGIMVLYDVDGNPYQFFVGPETAEGIKMAMTNYLNARAGQPMSFPPPGEETPS